MIEKTTARKFPDLSVEARKKAQKTIEQIYLDCVGMLDKKPFLELSFAKEKTVYADIINVGLLKLRDSCGDRADLIVRERKKYPFEGDRAIGETSVTNVYILCNMFVGEKEKKHVVTRGTVSSSLHSYDIDEEEAGKDKLEELGKLIEESDQYRAMMEKRQKD